MCIYFSMCIFIYLYCLLLSYLVILTVILSIYLCTLYLIILFFYTFISAQFWPRWGGAWDHCRYAALHVRLANYFVSFRPSKLVSSTGPPCAFQASSFY